MHSPPSTTADKVSVAAEDEVPELPDFPCSSNSFLEDLSTPLPSAVTTLVSKESPSLLFLSSREKGLAKKKKTVPRLDPFEESMLNMKKQKTQMTEDEHFAMSLVPRLGKLSEDKRSIAKMRIDMVMHEMQFGPSINSQPVTMRYPNIQHLIPTTFSTYNY